MAGRTPRSPTGLHSTSPAAPSIEDLLNITVNMHPIPSPRSQRINAASPTHTSPTHRSFYSPNLHNVHGVAASPSHHRHETDPLSASPHTWMARRSSMSNFSPRVVRGTIAGTSRDGATTSTATGSHRASVSPVRTRRASTTVNPHGGHRVASSSAIAPHLLHTQTPSPTAVPPPSQHATSFPLPEYLQHSAFRHWILSESEPTTPPESYHLGYVHASSAATSSRRSISPNAQQDTDGSDQDSTMGNGERGRTTTPVLQRKPADTYMRIPTRWSDTDRWASLTVSPDGRELTFHGSSNSGEKDAAAARTNYPIPAACGIYYYEIEILNKGQKGHIGIGFGHRSVKLNRLPGWEPKSWGYHGDDGNSFASEKEGKPFGPKFTIGDIVGCGIDFSTGRAFFTRNGSLIDPCFENIGSDRGELYPTVGLRTPNESIRTNFGQDPFKFDILNHVELARNAMWAEIQSTPISFVDGSFCKGGEEGITAEQEAVEIRKPLNELVLGYLAHHGYAKTAAALKAEQAQRDHTTGSEPHVQPSTIEIDGAGSSGSSSTIDLVPGANTSTLGNDTATRQSIVRAIASGDIDSALDETQEHYPAVLDQEHGIMLFKLRCRKFIELVLDAAAACRKLKEEEARAKGKEVANNGVPMVDSVESMDIDVDYAGTVNGRPRAKSSASLPMAALQLAISNGQALQEQYKTDTRPEVQTLYKKTLSLVAYDDPLADNPKVPAWVREMAGQGARDVLAEEVNRAILASQGRPPHPTLERLYRHTQASIIQLGWAGVGAAAFADMPKEFMDA
ncbi:hypothetical protein M422DRAFT_30095 [Sphaerobolus stellatus SS14]|uniref:SPRY-domain-containing protein n=1 Tax=Sphaerobolus stellatus (strain SS14) TaxID=990650 RepID=A0A0C9VDV6_SPHS4|nr:hypothetical protein M422DRAFT_30095 [Sphaerobolus stellatus SS14]